MGNVFNATDWRPLPELFGNDSQYNINLFPFHAPTPLILHIVPHFSFQPLSTNHHHIPISLFYYIHNAIDPSSPTYHISLQHISLTHHSIKQISFHSTTANPHSPHSNTQTSISITIPPILLLNQSTFISITIPFCSFHYPNLHYTFFCQMSLSSSTFSISFNLITHYSPIFHTHNPYSLPLYTNKQIP